MRFVTVSASRVAPTGDITMHNKQLGRLEEVSIREYWFDEARDFTPWLARKENLFQLGEAIGLEFDPKTVNQESEVGDFRVDILCKDIDGRDVIVENQLGRTDHGHLGQLLTYAAGKNAPIIVWIAKEFRDERRAAMDWLNEKTGGDAHFFGVQIELWKIGKSDPAPRFHVVSSPNDWTETVRAVQSHELTKSDQLRIVFWTGLRDVMVEREGGRVKARKTPNKDSWTTFSIGRSGIHLNALLQTTKNRVGVQLALLDDRAKAHYHLLYQDKGEIEKEIRQELVWRKLPEGKQSYIEIFWNDCDAQNESQWPALHKWLHDNLEAFHSTFHERIKNLDASDWQFLDDPDNDND